MQQSFQCHRIFDTAQVMHLDSFVHLYSAWFRQYLLEADYSRLLVRNAVAATCLQGEALYVATASALTGGIAQVRGRGDKSTGSKGGFGVTNGATACRIYCWVGGKPFWWSPNGRPTQRPREFFKESQRTFPSQISLRVLSASQLSL